MSLPLPDPHDPVPPSGPNPVAAVLKGVLKAFASLRLTVALLALGVVLVFFGTLAQKTAGMWTVVDKYFWSWVVMIDLQPTLEFCKIFLRDIGFPKNAESPSWAAVPFPGGKLIGGLMFLNLLAAHAVRFKLSWRRAGIFIAHSGLLLLFVGEAITREFQIEQRMTIPEGKAVNYTEDSRAVELAFTTPEADGTQRVTVVPGKMLERAARTHETISHPDLPVDVRVESYMVNSDLLDAKKVQKENPATTGLGLETIAEPKAEVSGVGDQTIDLPSAYVTLYKKGTDEKLGTYLASLWYTFNPFKAESGPKQAVTVGGATSDVALRYTRRYKPYSLFLKKFSFDRYEGTEQAKNYSSDLVLIDPEHDLRRDVRVKMNDPLRYRGETFYQSNFDKTTEKTTVLQVVRNPGWLLPYLSCVLVSVGLLIHFTQGLAGYLTRARTQQLATEAAAGAERPTLFERALPFGVVGLGALILLAAAVPKPSTTDLGRLARLPVVDGGRVKPLDTVARVALRKISGREEFVGDDGKMRPAVEWLMDAMASPPPKGGPAWKYKVVRIENDQVLSLLGLDRREGYRYSLEEIGPKIALLEAAVDKVKPREGGRKAAVDADEKARVERFFESGDRDVFGGQVLEVAEKLHLYIQLCSREVPLALPPAGDLKWRSLGQIQTAAQRNAMMAAFQGRGVKPIDMDKLPEEEQKKIDEEIRQLAFEFITADPSAMKFADVLFAFRNRALAGQADPERFTKALAAFQEATAGAVSPDDRAKANFEVYLNGFAPAYWVIYLYALAGFVAVGGWVAIGVRPPLAEACRRSAFWLLAFTFVAHGFALFARMYLMDRPLVFVTNLYSTAVFIGWTAVGLGLFMERVVPIGLGNIAAAVVGGATAIIAHNLAASGDTLEMMQAVLDTNFWLATHVTTINMGYAATYVAGVIGILYIWLGLFTPLLARTVGTGPAGRGQTLARVFGQLMYGVLCLATLLSFVGTVLGGIWADQSWGRFWGWDPKENGAVLIVLWNALILHARWCGLVKDRGIAVLTLVGNMITTWSYFGTNQLGVGLHAYGFSNTLATGCVITWVGHTVLIGMGLVPLRYWRSFGDAPQPGVLAAAAPIPVAVPAAGPALPVTAELVPSAPVTAAPQPVIGTNGHANGNGNGHHKPGKGKKNKKR
ncbi:cytochrome c assembly protein : Probable cytochrome c-type biogenesis protein OS=Planctomyces maris DSM 8797 GN=PM8797T_06360 PE=4 SV=1: ResB: ResB: Cytochrom_C_asm [Gemmataceae bacterium]|nr:cytochrome c assembly protein : Probable cytochrome c-type biogenesis protein OS=Planctomyces maris DSM 8797 GN=PM8797T_06360 PE=4 SV=1: ResB: ResB: Cytochrom_C_asm [Gemmataceae bacterium]VTT97270.1 cytochrome c assembly protein : Probable cytochrome c-type biogenesis protein OS=Planctomyces maris DSM 8797 GN=PM8797T_06360 PE=4 SV=1: ResB: ResB: Cytochrom_C_asm [Gemmataceae bacterium]